MIIIEKNNSSTLSVPFSLLLDTKRVGRERKRKKNDEWTSSTYTIVIENAIDAFTFAI